MILLDVSVDQIFFPNKKTQVTTQCRQLDSLLDEHEIRKEKMISIESDIE